ncbi:L-rhamnose mutarotase [Mycolicibacterium sp. 018/SC-01/001]|uniref:L-rhamnose mutarotase n=1 Tax=Mycolicibacterium sp. 018/SC-01/001 TaxID=2592069 RepID=UPI00117C6EBC|nr:L-rhamnose mutarotase [Mycolicibacterium sp. 018/SC-01/001]TRW78286.1 L-rhamnose mutarotase [Mycolicibacterium sp. 018/SC-01/001]
MSATAHTREPERVCFLLHLKPDRIADYLDAHTTVWPEMLDALRDAGYRNYSLFLRREDGLVVGYFECDDVDATMSAMAANAVNERWQSTMADYFEAADHPDRAMHRLTEYFHLTSTEGTVS